jgi:hypothetical protein
MTAHYARAITIDDDRYPGRTAAVLAWDWRCTKTTATTTLLLRGATGEYVVHRHTAPAGHDRIEALDGGAARALYRRMPMHVVPF